MRGIAKKRHEILREDAERKSKAVEQSLVNAQITSAMEARSATPLEAERVGKLIRQNYGAAGLQLVPLWLDTLDKIRNT